MHTIDLTDKYKAPSQRITLDEIIISAQNANYLARRWFKFFLSPAVLRHSTSVATFRLRLGSSYGMVEFVLTRHQGRLQLTIGIKRWFSARESVIYFSKARSGIRPALNKIEQFT